MKEGRFIGTVLAGIAAATLVAAPALAASSKSKVKVAFDNIGVLAEASGKANATIKEQRSKMSAKFKRLAPNTTYALVVGGLTEAMFTTSGSGNGKVRFAWPPKPGKDTLDFDPRGQRVAVNDGSSDVLAVVFSGSGEPDDIIVDERALLTPTALAPGAKAEARFRIKKDGRTRFTVKLQGVAPGDYDLFVDGVFRAAISTNGAGKGQVEFDSEAEPGKILLDFDPRGLPIDISQGANVVITGDVLAPGDGITQCTFSEDESFLASTGVDPDGKAKARLRVRDDCDRDFRVEVEDVPLGAYDVVVGGIPRGMLTVIDTGTGIEGQIEFDTDPNDPGEVLLDFDPVGQSIQIVQVGTGTIFFDDTFTLGGGAGGGSACTPTETELPLLNIGPDPDAKGKARFRLRDDCDEDFRVEIEDLPLGDYNVLVGGVSRGSITVALVLGEPEGELEFDTDPNEPGEILLDFDPRGALIEIEQAGTIFLSRIFDDGSGGGPPPTCSAFDQEPALVNIGPDPDAKGKARYRAEVDCDADFRVEIEDLPLGDYELLVGGVNRGTITVVLVLGEPEGELEFDTDPDQPGEVLLTFDPLGQLVEVVQGGTVFLSLAFPS